jgi:TPP-dependent indolepyruvate ferredoxin oxidoreductase alpha subunit
MDQNSSEVGGNRRIVKQAQDLSEPFKCPILYRSKKGGVRYRLSEILIQRDPKVVKANREFNRENMQNKLLKLSSESSKENKTKLEELLKERNSTQIKTIREGSMRLLLKEYLHFKSDLSKSVLIIL